jgi:membrane protein DedA with SNARE-associated domain
MFEQILNWIVTFVHDFGYVGLFVMTFLESTFTPIPSEVTVVPAGFLIHQGKMHVLPVMLSCIAGTMSGSYFTYWFAQRFGVRFVKRYGKYFFFSADKLVMVQTYFKEHGSISVFTGRLLPGIRHVIGFPAGLAEMKISLFFIYTFLGSTLWTIILLLVGYFIGSNREMLAHYVTYIKIGMLLAVLLLLPLYIWNHRRKKAKK